MHLRPRRSLRKSRVSRMPEGSLARCSMNTEAFSQPHTTSELDQN